MENSTAFIIGCIAIIAIALVWSLAFAAIFMVVWNIFVPAVFGGPTIDFITALAGSILITMIGGAFRSYTSK